MEKTDKNYSIESILDIIELSKEYEKGRKRKRNRLDYNLDLERLHFCTGPLKKLNELVGMEDIKKNIIDQILFYTQKLNTTEMMHICLTGPPGVGKTTVGKILAELYSSLGFLESGNFKIAERSDLIGGYLGQTAIKTKKFLKESIGSVLMIDEIYSLGSGKEDSDSYSKECIDTINQFLSENTSNFMMIIAGYSDEVERCFFQVNPGLSRRFPWRYNITQYTSNNLREIFVYQVKENGWDFDENLDLNLLDNLFSKKEYFKDNGGSTLQLFDKSKICHSRRVFGKGSNIKKKLNLDDINTAFELIKKQVTKKAEPPYGMYI